MSERRPHILLVDDQQLVLRGLQRMLSRIAKAFEISTACSGDEALDKLAQAPFTVIVSDLKMPGMDGIQLLEEVARAMPAIGRVLLSGTADANAVTRALPTAHRFLCKPCRGTTIIDTCGELHRYGSRSAAAGAPDRSPGQAIGSVVALAIDASTMRRARAEIAGGRDALLEVIDHPALAAALLHTVGSEFLGARTEVATLVEALDTAGSVGFERLLDSRFLLVVDGDPARPTIALAERARARAAAVRQRGGSHTDALAALLLEVDRLGTSDLARWSGLREGGDAATLLGLWGAPAPIVERVAHMSAASTTRPVTHASPAGRSHESS